MFLRSIKNAFIMAKGSMLMNLTAGKLGSMVFYRSKGEQRIRTYVQKIANPKSVSQMGQRTQLSNLVALYRILKPVLTSGFSNKKTKQSDYNAFVSRNLNRVQVYITKEMAKDQGCVVAPYQVTDGVIAPIEVTGTGVGAVTDLFVGTDFVIDATTTVGALSTALIANNTDLTEGVQLSYLSVIQTQSVQTGYPTCVANYYKMVLNSASTAKVLSLLPIQAVAVVDGYIGHGAFVADGAFCWILSKKDVQGKLQVSPQRLIVTSEEIYIAYSSGQARSNAGESYGQAPDPFLNPSSDLSSGSGDVMRVASVSIKGVTSKQGMTGPLSYAIGDEMIISGTALDPANMGALLSTTPVRLSTTEALAEAEPLESFLGAIVATPTSIKGKLITAVSAARQIVLTGSDRVLLQHTYVDEEAPDPTN